MPSSTNSTASPTAVNSGGAAAPPNRPARRSISALFLIAVGLALVPVSLLSFTQAWLRLERDREVARERLVESARSATSEELNVFGVSEHVLQVLSLQDDVRAAAPGCGVVLKSALIGLPFLANIGRISADGMVTCSALPIDGAVDVKSEAWWQAIDWSKPFSVSGPVLGLVTKRRVIAGVLPLFRPDGARDGALSAAIDLAWLDRTLKLRTLDEGAVVALLDANGKTIAASVDALGDLPAFAIGADRDAIGKTESTDGQTWSYATAPLVPGVLHIAFAMPDRTLFASTAWHVGADLLLPVVAMVLASFAIWLAAHRWVIRHVRGLQGLAERYTQGDYEARANGLARMPVELAELGDDLHAMADHALDRDRRLQDALKQKALLVREVHHRVKNNLQIVVSLLSLQAGRLTDPEARAPLEQARTRIGALALVHRLLLDMEEQSFVDMRYLMSELCINLRQALGSRARNIELTSEVDEVRLPTDTAIPLTLFTVEAVTNAFRHAFPARARGKVTVSLKAEGGSARLDVTDDGAGFDAVNTAQGTGLRLLRAFSQQLAGTLSMDAAPGRASTISITFPLPDPAAEGGTA